MKGDNYLLASAAAAAVDAAEHVAHWRRRACVAPAWRHSGVDQSDEGFYRSPKCMFRLIRCEAKQGTCGTHSRRLTSGELARGYITILQWGLPILRWCICVRRKKSAVFSTKQIDFFSSVSGKRWIYFYFFCFFWQMEFFWFIFWLMACSRQNIRNNGFGWNCNVVNLSYCNRVYLC